MPKKSFCIKGSAAYEWFYGSPLFAKLDDGCFRRGSGEGKGFPKNFPAKYAATHIGFYLYWLLENYLLNNSRELSKMFAKEKSFGEFVL